MDPQSRSRPDLRGDRLAAALRRARATDGRSAEAVARQIEISVETIRAIEQRKIPNPGFFTVALIGRELAVDLDELAQEALEASR